MDAKRLDELSERISDKRVFYHPAAECTVRVDTLRELIKSARREDRLVELAAHWIQDDCMLLTTHESREEMRADFLEALTKEY